MTAPSGEVKAEAQMHLEEQALIQFKADVSRQKKVREFAQKALLRGSEAREREIRI